MDWLNDLLDDYDRKELEGEQRYRLELNREIEKKKEMTEKFDRCLEACVIPVINEIKGKLESKYPCESSAPEIRDEKTGEKRREKVLLGVIPDRNAPKYDEYRASIISFSFIPESGALNVKKLVRKNHDPIAHDSNPIKINGVTKDCIEEEIRNFLEKVFT
jgi:hypothetical protein